MDVHDINWQDDIAWHDRVAQVFQYYLDRPRLKFGPKKLNKAFPFIDLLCEKGSVTQAEATSTFNLLKGDIATILSNVTMAIQGHGEVWSPELGGWYTTRNDPYAYVVSPDFAVAWKPKQQIEE